MSDYCWDEADTGPSVPESAPPAKSWNMANGDNGGRNWRQRDGQNDDRRRGRGSFRGGGQRNSEKFGQCLTVPIRSNDVGRIIGKGGSRIRELEEESGARIKVNRDGFDDGESIIELRGSESACAIAEQRIKDLLTPPTYKETYSEPVKDDTPINWKAVINAGFEDRQKKWASLPTVIRDFYFEDPDVAHMSTSEVKSLRQDNNAIAVSHYNADDTRPIPNPVVHFFQAFQQYPEILEEIYKQGFQTPSPIQMQAWPILLQGYDMIGIAQTGTGKTLAFLLPALIHIEGQPMPREERVGPTVLILAPTRELAQQIERETKKYRYRNIKCVCIYGGGSRRDQINIVANGVEIVIATPGRLSDLMMNKFLDLSSVSYLVLDEADRMLDMGFEPQIKKILLDVRPDRQSLMTSATWPAGVRRLATQYMNNPMQVCVGSLDLAAVHSVTQRVMIVEDDEKRPKLYEFIANMDPDDKIIVFCDKKVVADDVASDLILHDIQCQCIHGDREQCDREQALDDLATGLVRILVATDVAARGLDIKDISHVLNYDFPRNVEEYVHRVGRTGRAGRLGESLTFVTRGDWKNAQNLIDILEEASQEVPPGLVDMASRFRAWKERKEAEENAFFGSGRGGGRRGGGRRGGSRGGSRWNNDY